MNIDVRDITGDVLKCMKLIIQEKKFTSTAKATRYIIVEFFNQRKKITGLENNIIELERKLKKAEKEIKDSDKFKKALNKFIKD